MFKIKKGLDVPILGTPEHIIENASKVDHVAILGSDFHGLKPSMRVKVGDSVKKGQVVFEDKKTAVAFCSPAGGKVVEINRGEKRVLQSVVIEVAQEEEAIEFSKYEKDQLQELKKEDLVKILIDSGLWTSLRQRPFSIVADPNSTPHSLFINTMDTNPLGLHTELIINEEKEHLENGIKILSKLVSGKTHVCSHKNSSVQSLAQNIEGIEFHVFDGPHPAGLTGTHIHNIDPVGKDKLVWSIDFQDVIRISKLLLTGEFPTEVIVSIAGSEILRPRHVRTRVGAKITELLANELSKEKTRIISGSVLSGKTAAGVFDYLGQYHHQVSAIKEGGHREFLGWMGPGFEKYSVKNTFLSKLNFNKKFTFDTDTNGSLRAIVPIGCYEKVMPLDIQPTYLLRSLLSHSVAEASELGCLELDEEDLGLCTFVCPGKNEYASALRKALTVIEKEG